MDNAKIVMSKQAKTSVYRRLVAALPSFSQDTKRNETYRLKDDDAWAFLAFLDVVVESEAAGIIPYGLADMLLIMRIGGMRMATFAGKLAMRPPYEYGNGGFKNEEEYKGFTSLLVPYKDVVVQMLALAYSMAYEQDETEQDETSAA